MIKNGYPTVLIDRTVSFFLNKLKSKPTEASSSTSPSKSYQIILPYLGSYTKHTEKKIKQALKDTLPNVKFNFVYRASTRLRSLFAFKDNIPSYLRSGLIYKYTCDSCKAIYIGETGRHQKTRFSEHIGISARTEKIMKTQKE